MDCCAGCRIMLNRARRERIAVREQLKQLNKLFEQFQAGLMLQDQPVARA